MARVKWSLDATHSKIHFKVKHLMINQVTGTLDDFNIHASAEGEQFSHL